MSIFLRLSERYGAALDTFDPLRGEWLFRLIDPWPGGCRGGKPRWLRIAGLTLGLFGPLWLFFAVPSATFSGPFLGNGGIVLDFGVYGIFLYEALSLALMPIARRLLGDLLNELVCLGVVQSTLRDFNPASSPKGGILRFLEWATRVEGRRAVVPGILFVANAVDSYCHILASNRPLWHCSPSEPGSLFHFLSIGNMQPNLAGLWAYLLFFPFSTYLVWLTVRLFVVFACLCTQIARSEKLNIIPSHPDGTGGLQPIGQVALLFSLFPFAAGLDLVGITANQLAWMRAFRMRLVPCHVVAVSPAHWNSAYVFYGAVMQWVAYLILGSLLFFLPLLPLRARMAAAKRQYLIKSAGLQNVAAQEHGIQMDDRRLKPESLQGFFALNGLVQAGSDMAIWPFDKKTFLRYAGLLLSPLAPIVAEQLPRSVTWIRAFLGLG